MASITANGQTTAATGFVDLATFDELEKYLYGSANSYTYFVREAHKSTWFTQVPVLLSRNAGQPGFGQDWSVGISRAADYLMHTWLRVIVPEITLLNGNVYAGDGRLRLTRNFMHNLIKEVNISFNDLVAASFNNYQLDFWTSFTVPASKRVGYDNMIGNVDNLIAPHAPGVPIASQALNLPLPFFFSRDSGVALPTAALPFNEMRINFTFRNWEELMILENSANPAGVNNITVPVVGRDIAQAPELTGVQVLGNYAIVSNEERKRMACNHRDILIEQVQVSPRQTFSPTTHPNPSYDIRFSHAIKALFFAVRNNTHRNVWSNYTAASPVPGPTVVNFSPSGAADPIANTSLTYENNVRFTNMGSDYFSLINPWYHATSIPTETGYHMYSYSLKLEEIDPMGSTNYAKLTNVSIAPAASLAAVTGAAGTGGANSGQDYPQNYEFVVTAVNNNIVRISGGAFGFPIL